MKRNRNNELKILSNLNGSVGNNEKRILKDKKRNKKVTPKQG